ncbi:YhgE/Pip domain-containing protein [Lactococcus insecticola]|uniref:Membrane protein n=1 Tax=Pseudolactococcus insecticola TaxID=2709158 RepID=A0A6A0B3Z0_9LACT|nr:YhgE/Pip domain-containing protein [Lactococcus insecticola]GFH39756.1 membrane protein [Lactococcus insecticola]
MIKKEWQAILHNRLFMAIIIALALIPALYNLIFLSSMWDPYGKIKDLPVAVVNQDKAATISGSDKTISLGKDLVAKLAKNDSLDYHFVSEKTAKSGIKSGKYFMVITLPDDFSSSAAGLLDDGAKPAEIDYQTSKGHNFISAKMSESAMEKLKAEVSNNITATYTQAVFDNLNTLKAGMTDASKGSQKVTSGASALVSGSKTLSDGLGILSSQSVAFSDGTQQLSSGLTQYTAGVGQLSSGATALKAGIAQYTAGTGQVASGLSALDTSSQKLTAGAENLAAGTQKVADLSKGTAQLNAGLSELAKKSSLSKTQKAQLTTLETGMTALNTAIQDFNTQNQAASDSTTLTNLLTSIATNAQTIIAENQAQQADQLAALKATATYKSLTASEQDELTSAISTGSSDITSQATQTLQAAQGLKTALETLAANQAKSQAATAQIAAAAAQALPAGQKSLSDLSTGLTNINTALTTQVLPASQALTTGSGQLDDALSSGASALNTGISQYTSAVSKLNTGAVELSNKSEDLTNGAAQVVTGSKTLSSKSNTLLSGASKLSDGASKLTDGTGKLASGGTTLNSGLTTLENGSATLSHALSSGVTKLNQQNLTTSASKVISKPLVLKHKDTDKSATNGVGMAPYMISVALFVGALSTNMLIGNSLSGAKFKSRRDWFLGKLATNGVIALAQGILVNIAVHLLGLSATHEVATFFFIILISLSFMSLVTFLNTALGKPGSFLVLILLLLQLASSAGTYPLALTDKFFQTINPWLPMTYAVSGIREVVSLTGNIGVQTIILLGVAIVFAILAPLTLKKSDLKAV